MCVSGIKPILCNCLVKTWDKAVKQAGVKSQQLNSGHHGCPRPSNLGSRISHHARENTTRRLQTIAPRTHAYWYILTD